MTVAAVITDIEGTTSSLAFVKDVLFPYATEHLAEYVRSHTDAPDVERLLADARIEAGRPDLDSAATIELLLTWIAEDRKATPLKSLQGLIWEAGYRHGALKGHIYVDAVRQLRAWHARGLPLYVYSSGSVRAQKLLFAHTEFGDLTPLFSGFFDTHIGHKREPESYRRIQAEVGLVADRLLFLSDIVEELDAARAAGWQTVGLAREGLVPTAGTHHWVADFDQINCESGRETR
ncbi:MAG: acireductone synthase [Thiotrichales bacterium]